MSINALFLKNTRGRKFTSANSSKKGVISLTNAGVSETKATLGFPNWGWKLFNAFLMHCTAACIALIDLANKSKRKSLYFKTLSLYIKMNNWAFCVITKSSKICNKHESKLIGQWFETLLNNCAKFIDCNYHGLRSCTMAGETVKIYHSSKPSKLDNARHQGSI